MMRQKYVFYPAVVFLLVVLFRCNFLCAEEATLFANFNSIDMGSMARSGWRIGGGSSSHNAGTMIGLLVIPEGTLPVTRIEIVIKKESGGNSIKGYLMTDAYGPATVIESLSFPVPPAASTQPSILSATSLLHPVLEAGHRYWLVLEAPDMIGDSFFWCRHVSQPVTSVAQRTGTAGAYSVGDAYGAMLRVFGNDLVSGSTSIRFEIGDRGGVSLMSSQRSTGTIVGYGSVLPDEGSTTPSGLAIFGFRQNGIVVSEASVSASVPMRSGIIPVEIGNRVNTGLAMVNPNPAPSTLSFYFTDSGGRLGHGMVTIPAFGQISGFLNQTPFLGPSPFSGTFTFVSPLPIACVALRGLNNERRDFLLTTLPVTNLEAPVSGDALIFPHFADGGGWTSQIILVNPTDRVMHGTVRFLDTAGDSTIVAVNDLRSSEYSYSIDPQTSYVLKTSGASESILTGSIKVTPALSNEAPVGLTIFSFRRDGITVSEAGVPYVPAGNAFRLYAETYTDPDGGTLGSIQSGLAFANVSSAGSEVTLTLTDLDGSPANLTGTLTIPAGGQKAMFLNQVPGFESLTSPFQGILRVTSTERISLVGLRGRSNSRGDFLITTTPPVSEVGPASSEPMFFPQIADSGGYTTQFILFSGKAGQSSAGNMLVSSQSGESLEMGLQTTTADIKMIWSEQFDNGVIANYLPEGAGTTGDAERYILMAVRSDGKAYAGVRLDFPPGMPSGDVIVRLAKVGDNGKPIPAGESRLIETTVSSGRLSKVFSLSAPVHSSFPGDDVPEFGVAVFRDYNSNGIIEPDEPIIDWSYPDRFKIITQERFGLALLEVEAALSVGKLQYPLAASFLEAFLHGTSPAEATNVLSLLFSRELNHHTGLIFTGADPSGFVPKYIFSKGSALSKAILKSNAFRKKLAEALCPSAPGEPGNAELTGLIKFGVEDEELGLTFGTARISAYLTPGTNGVHITGSLVDIYDWSFEAGILDAMAASVQAGFYTLDDRRTKGGDIFRSEVLFDDDILDVPDCPCANIAGIWEAVEEGELSMTLSAFGITDTDRQALFGIGYVHIYQEGCSFHYNPLAMQGLIPENLTPEEIASVERKGKVIGNLIVLEGPMAVVRAVSEDLEGVSSIDVSKNLLRASGSIADGQIVLDASGDLELSGNISNGGMHGPFTLVGKAVTTTTFERVGGAP